MTGLQCRSDLLDRLAKLDELIAGQKATLGLLERERLQLQTQLRLSGYRAPATQSVLG